jgi:DNA replication licensing factor MCM7
MGFIRNVTSNTKRYVKLMATAADNVMPLPVATELGPEDTLDVAAEFRRRHMQVDAAAAAPAAGGAADAPAPQGMLSMPADLRRRFYVNFLPLSTDKHKSIRQIRAIDLGGLVTVRAIVTRVTDVKPLVTVATYTCDMCGHEIYQPIDSKTYLPLQKCESAECKANKSTGNLYMQTRGSKFDKLQEIRIQELPEQVPVGHIPRSMTIHARGSCTRACMPGDVITCHGMFLPTPYTGFRAMKAGLSCDTYLHATAIVRSKKGYSEIKLSEDVETSIEEYASPSFIHVWVFARLCCHTLKKIKN